MFSWLRNSIRNHRQRRANHEASWAGFDQVNSEGVTRFQTELVSELKKDPGFTTIELVKGNKESYYKGTLVGSGLEVYLYEDGAHLGKAPLERWGFASRQELAEYLLKRAREI